MITIATAGFAVFLILILVAFIGLGIIISKEEDKNDKLKIENKLLKKELQPYREKKERQERKAELKSLLKEIEKEKR